MHLCVCVVRQERGERVLVREPGSFLLPSLSRSKEGRGWGQPLLQVIGEERFSDSEVTASVAQAVSLVTLILQFSDPHVSFRGKRKKGTRGGYTEGKENSLVEAGGVEPEEGVPAAFESESRDRER